jgi:hypothetical protein
LPALRDVSEEDRLLLVREELFDRLTAELSSVGQNQLTA